MAVWGMSAAAHDFLGGMLPRQLYARERDDPGYQVARSVIAPPLPAATATESPNVVAFRASVLGEAETIEVEPTPGGAVKRTVSRRRPAASFGRVERWLIIDRFGVEQVVEGTLAALRREYPDVTEGRRRCGAGAAIGSTPRRIFRLER